MDLLHSLTAIVRSQNHRRQYEGRSTMTDVTVNEAETEAPPFIPTITLKGDAGSMVVDFRDFPDATYQAILVKGLEAFLNQANGAAKSLAGITKLEGKELEDRKKEVLKAAEATLEQLKAGTVPGAKKAKASGAVQTEAMRLAKNMVKDLIRNSGQKIGAYSAKEHTAAAKV